MRKPSARLVLAVSLLATLSVFSGACSSSKPAPESPPAPRQDAAYSQQAAYPQPAATAAPTATAEVLPGQPGASAGPGFWANLPLPPDVPSALIQLDAAERAILLATGAPSGDAQPTSPTAKRPEPAGGTLAQDQACLIACTALASMKRSADHVCTMAGDKDAACGTARERVQRAEARVTAACPACSK